MLYRQGGKSNLVHNLIMLSFSLRNNTFKKDGNKLGKRKRKLYINKLSKMLEG